MAGLKWRLAKETNQVSYVKDHVRPVPIADYEQTGFSVILKRTKKKPANGGTVVLKGF